MGGDLDPHGGRQRWAEFRAPVRSATGKTMVWPVSVFDADIPLGEVRWFGRWRKYAFFPVVGTVFEETCLRDIADFCVEKTREWRLARKAKP